MPGVCPRCNREVYFAEEKLALGKVWHTFCFSCRNCRKLLNSCNVVTHLDELFCKNCYARLSLSSVNYETKKSFNPSPSLTHSVHDSLNCDCRGIEGSIGNALLSRKQYYQPDKCRLRGGGSQSRQTSICLDEEKKEFLENECPNLGTNNSMTTLCDPPPSPTAITTWYNRQHSKFRSECFIDKNYHVSSGLSLESQCRFAVQHPEIEQVALKPAFSDNESNVTDTQISADKTRVTSASGNNKINKYDPVREYGGNSVIIPSRRKFAYPPVPPPRSPLPSRRRVSFCDVVLGDTRGNDRNCMNNMQDVHRRSCCNKDNNEEYDHSYDIWQADNSVGKNDGGYENNNVNQTEDTSRMHFAKTASDSCDAEDATNKYNDIENSCVDGNSELRTYRTMNDKDEGSSKEDVASYVHQNHPNSSNEFDENDRMRGGCGGSCGPRPRLPCGTIKVIETTCNNCMKREPDPCRSIVASCVTCASPCSDRRGCCPPLNERPICKKPIIRCRPPCTSEPQGCGGGGCCGSGCRGGCGKPGQTCLPARSCIVPPCRPCSPCSPRPCPPPTICCCSRKCGNCCGTGGVSCCRSKSPVCRVRTRRCCSTDRAESNDVVCCRPRACECLGGGPDCQRCGRKVYQAEMQTVSGIPYHQICFSCFCCRKPLEPLTYQENCGEIYCKQCYVRNFGPQGYGYGVGPGALQTPM